MLTITRTPVTVVVAAALLVGCANSAVEQERRQFVDERVTEILAPADGMPMAETKRCLSNIEFRSFEALDSKHILFEGSRDRLWINTLRARCPDLRHSSVLRVREFSGQRMCDGDLFSAGDLFTWPWYRRWPWYWGPGWGGTNCALGSFQAVTKEQVSDIRAAIRAAW